MTSSTSLVASSTPKQFPGRWRLTRAGIVNVWHYLENEFDVSGGRMILRGTNGSGKSRALELLLPFLLDGDRRKMDATGSGRVSLDELMSAGGDDATTRSGYLWLELSRPDGHLTVGALLRHSRSSKRTQVWYFLSPLRVGIDLALLSDAREPLTREALTELIGAEAITESADTHRERVREQVFRLRGDSGRDRFDGLRQLLHTLRAPDIGNRIDEGQLPRIVSDALPPLDEQILVRAGERLDDLRATREAQQRLENSLEHVARFHAVYRRYAAGVLLGSADDTAEAITRLGEAEQRAAERAREHESIAAELARARSSEQVARDQVSELERAVSALKDKAIFKQASDLVQREKRVGALETTASAALAEAGRERDAHAAAVRRAESRLDELGTSVAAGAAELAAAWAALELSALDSGALPEQLRVERRDGRADTAIVRAEVHRDPEPVARPVCSRAEVFPDDPTTVVDAVHALTAAAEQRRELAATRQVEAERLEKAERSVLKHEADAETAAAQADVAETDASTRAGERDDEARRLASAWQRWVSDPDAVLTLGEPDPSADPALGALLADPDALLDADTIGLNDLDDAPGRLASPTRTALADERSDLRGLGRADAERRRALQAEADDLRRERDPAPFEPPWLATDRPGTPFWRVVDFAPALGNADRAGLEGALLASGLLTATIERDATVRAADGSVLVTPPTRAMPVESPLSDALRPDATGELATLVSEVLAGIGLGTSGDVTVAVGVDGSWRNGHLRGRHVPTVARHVGAAARENARRARLAEIESQLAELERVACERAARLDEIGEREHAIVVLVTGAPRSAELHAARRLADDAARRADRARGTARALHERASDARRRWSGELAVHRQTCEHYGLPTSVEALRQTASAARNAAESCRTLARRLLAIDTAIGTHRARVADAEDAARTRDDAETRADARWRDWHDLAAEVAALREAIGLDVEQARDELRRSEDALNSARTDADRARGLVERLGPQEGTARSEAEHARDAVGSVRGTLGASTRRLERRLALPGVLAAVTDERFEPLARPDDAEQAGHLVQTLRAAVHRPSQPADANAVLRGFQIFAREVSGQLDTVERIDDNVTVVTVVGQGDDHTVPGVFAALTRAVDQGRAALTEREREVFTSFVIGGVAEELRRRINQAGALVAAMNASLDSIRTSNGIGVRLSWHLVSDDADLAAIARLVQKADAVRSADDTETLTELLRTRVERRHADDPAAGYARHLAAALDYRAWHEIEVTILGPAPGQQRRISKRAKLSQGETRFVSYVTLFAAADGYLSGLSDDGTQLRLILLDDAFAKVDDPTIAELMGLLVHLDLDFVMTGHALWGCFASVPELDVYEVRRAEGTSAVTTHIHWDGHQRHLRSTA